MDIDNFSFIPYLIDNACELKKFTVDRNLLTASALTQLQRLPITLRRRAASHNVKRLPFRLRRMATNDAAKRIVKKCRKFKRRHMDIKAIYATRQIKNKWLYTHIWHAKRFHIEKKWGWRVPVVPNQKTFRPCTKAMSDGSAIVDISYYNSYELYGPQSTILERIKSIISVEETSDILNQLLKGSEVYIILYEHNQYPYGAICPVKIIMVGEIDMTSFLLTVHPAAVEQVVSALSNSFDLKEDQSRCWHNTSDNITLIDRSGENCRFRLLGSVSHRILSSLLIDSNEISRLAEWPLSQISTGYTVEALVNNPELSKPRLKQTDPEPWKKLPWRKTKDLSPIHIGVSAFQIDKVLRQAISDRKVIPIDNMKHLERIKEDEKCSIRLLRHKYGGNTIGGWDVLVPAKWAMKVWSSLIMKGCRPMGLKYWTRYCAVESSSLVSKYDCYPMVCWPDTVQGRLEADQSAKRQLSAWGRRPRAKRVNFKQQATEHPFSCPYQSLMPDQDHRWFVLRDQETQARVVENVLRGEVKVSIEELDSWRPDMRHSLVPVMVASVRSMARQYGLVMAAVSTDTVDTVLEAQDPSDSGGAMIRPILGYLEMADQAMTTGRPSGAALLSFYRLVAASAARPNTNLFWVKNPNERRLIPVTLSASR